MKIEDQGRRLVGGPALSSFPSPYLYYYTSTVLFYDFIIIFVSFALIVV